MLHVYTTESHGDGDGIVNHSIASGVPEKALRDDQPVLSCFLEQSNIAPPTHEKLLKFAH